MEKNIIYSSEQENIYEDYILDYLYQSAFMEHNNKGPFTIRGESGLFLFCTS